MKVRYKAFFQKKNKIRTRLFSMKHDCLRFFFLVKKLKALQALTSLTLNGVSLNNYLCRFVLTGVNMNRHELDGKKYEQGNLAI